MTFFSSVVKRLRVTLDAFNEFTVRSKIVVFLGCNSSDFQKCFYSLVSVKRQRHAKQSHGFTYE